MGNSDSKNKINIWFILVKKIEIKTIRKKFNPCKFVCSLKNVFVKYCLHANLSACANLTPIPCIHMYLKSLKNTSKIK